MALQPPFYCLAVICLLWSCNPNPATILPDNEVSPNAIRLTLTEGTNMAAAASPNGREIAIDLHGTLWILPVMGGKARPITDKFGDARQPAWSPDGKRICFQGYWEGNWHIYTVNKDGKNLRQLTNDRYDHREPHWSPDGNEIVFSSDRSGNYDIWTYLLNSEDLRQITDSEAFDEYGPVWSPNGNKIMLVAKQGPEYQIREITLRNGEIRNFYTTESEIYGLSYSPSQTKLLFNTLQDLQSQLASLDITSDHLEVKIISEENEDVFPFHCTWISIEDIIYTASGQIIKYNLANTQRQKIPFTAKVVLERPNYADKKRDFDISTEEKVKGIYQPIISPDESTIAFIALGDLWLKKSDGQFIRITHDKYIQLAPSWAAKGDRLAYASDQDGSTAIWIYDLEKENNRKLGQTAGMPVGLDWSSKDEEIAFTLNHGPRAGLLWKMNAESGKVQRLGHPLPYSVSGPSWSADDQTIVLSVLRPYSKLYREGINRIVLCASDGSGTRSPRNLDHWSFGMRGNDGPNWSPDGKQLAFLSKGFLWLAEINQQGDFISEPKKLTKELSDSPSWTGDSRKIMYQTPRGLKLIQIESKETRSIPTDLAFLRKINSATKLIQNVSLFDGITNELQTNKDVLISGHRIVSILDHDPTHVADTIINGTSLYLMPGLIDIHAHQGSDLGESLGRKWLAWGITSSRDPATNPYDALNRREAQRSGALVGPRIFFTGSPLDGNRVYYGGTYALQNKNQLLLELDRAEALDYDMLKTYVRLPDPLQKEVIERAHTMGIPVSSHEIYPAVSYGIDAVEHILGTSRRGYSPKMSRTFRSYEDVTDLIARSRMSFTPTISIYVGYDYILAKNPRVLSDRRIKILEPAHTIEAARQKIAAVRSNSELWEKQFQNAAKMLRDIQKKGGLIVAGTDGPIIPYGFGLHIELECYQMAGLSPFEVLQTATVNAAKAMGVGKDLGVIEQGKLADMILLRSNPLDDVTNARDISSVILNGEVIRSDRLLKHP